jgi:hypothetical protein
MLRSSPRIRIRIRAYQVFAVLALAAVLGDVTSASAQSGDAATAEALFREGRKLSDTGDVEGACAKFRESRRLDPAIGTTFNIADCEEKLGHLAEAWSSFQEVMQVLPATDRRRGIAESRAAALDKRLPKLRIRLAGDAPAGTHVERDGVALGAPSLGIDLPVNPGAHQIVVLAPGREPGRYEITLAEAQHVSVDVAPGAASASGSPGETGPVHVDATTHTSDGSGSRTLGYVLGGIGVAGIVTGAVAGALVLSKKSTVDDNCNAQKRCNDEGLSAVDSGKTLSVVSTVGFVTGVVGLGAGAYFLFTAGPSRDGTVSASATVTGRF